MMGKVLATVGRWIDRLSLIWLVPLAVFMALAPWPMGPEPHLVEKARMFAEGTLTRPLDIFDVFWHGTAAILLVIKLARLAYRRWTRDSTPES